MNPFARFSASVGLTLVAWGPNTWASLQDDRVDLGHSAGRFLLIFVLARVAIRGFDQLLRTYGTAARNSMRDPIEATTVDSPGSAARPSPNPTVDRRRKPLPKRAGDVTAIDAIPTSAPETMRR